MKENETNCAVVRDLLPLYHEKLCSEETGEFVAGHLAGCAACTGAYEALRTELPGTPSTAERNTAPLKAMRKTYRGIRMRTLVMAIILATVIAVVGIWAGVTALSNLTAPFPISELNQFVLYQTTSGNVWSLMESTMHGYQTQETFDPETGIYAITLQRSYWDKGASEPIGTISIGYNLKAEDGRVYFADTEADDEGIWHIRWTEVKKFLVGNGKDADRILWSAGKPLPVKEMPDKWGDWWAEAARDRELSLDPNYGKGNE